MWRLDGEGAERQEEIEREEEMAMIWDKDGGAWTMRIKRKRKRQ